MAWDIRPCGSYYYQSVRVGKQVTRRYIGTGPVAELVAEEHAEARAEQLAAANAFKRLKSYLGELDGLMKQHHELVDLVMSGVLLAAGYHRQRYRKEWRMRYARRKRKAG